MAKRQTYAEMPVRGGVRRRRTSQPSFNGTVIDYNVSQSGFDAVSSGHTGLARAYVPGLPYGLVNGIGPAIVSAYSSAKFLPGTSLRWEPSVAFTSTGRVFVGFTDNPEVAVQIRTLLNIAIASGLAADWNAYLTSIKGLGSTISFPIWQETSIVFPTRLRRKMFDTNETINTLSVDDMDRCMQTSMFLGIEGLPAGTTASPGGMWYHDKVSVEGIHGRLT